jgi:dihydropteroate synthase
MRRTIGKKTFDFGKKTYTMGILNITPDSFSDGGFYVEKDSAYKRALNIIEEGADILDIGAESSRPGSDPVDNIEEWSRLEPVLEQLAGKISIPISLDTYKSDVAEKALRMGVEIINDISGLKMDKKMAEVVAKYDAYIVIMHMRGNPKNNPKNMQENPYYENVVDKVISELEESIKIAEEAGIKREKIILDPGIGFAKRFEDNLILIKNIDKIAALGYPLLLGVSRKRFIGEILDNPTDRRLAGSLAVAVYSASKGVDIMRVHDVRETVEALKVTEAILKAGIN